MNPDIKLLAMGLIQIVAALATGAVTGLYLARKMDKRGLAQSGNLGPVEEIAMSRVWWPADARRARIFETHNPMGNLREKEDLVQATGRTQARALAYDRPGRSYDSHGQGRHDGA